MQLNQNALICANDYCGDASLTFQANTGTPGLPLTNILLPELYKPGQFSAKDVDSTEFIVDLGKIVPINMIALLKHNLTYVSKWQVQLFDDDPLLGGSAIYDSGLVNCFPVISGFGGLEWGEFLWGGSLEEYAIVTPEGFNRHTFMPIDTVYARYMDVRLADSNNPSLPQIGRLFVSKGYQPSFNISYGSSIVPIDTTEVSEARSGVRHYGRVTKRKQLQMIFELLPSKELLFNIFGPIHLRCGKAGELLVLMNPSDPETWFFESVFGNMPEVERSEYSFFNRMGTTLTVDEAV